MTLELPLKSEPHGLEVDTERRPCANEWFRHMATCSAEIYTPHRSSAVCRTTGRAVSNNHYASQCITTSNRSSMWIAHTPPAPTLLYLPGTVLQIEYTPHRSAYNKQQQRPAITTLANAIPLEFAIPNKYQTRSCMPPPPHVPTQVFVGRRSVHRCLQLGGHYILA